MTRSFDFDDWTRRLDERLDHMHRRGERAGAALAGATFTGRDRDGTVTVTVGAAGNLLAADFTDKATGLPPARLSAALMDAHAQAADAAAAHVHLALNELGVGDLDAVAAGRRPEGGAE